MGYICRHAKITETRVINLQLVQRLEREIEHLRDIITKIDPDAADGVTAVAARLAAAAAAVRPRPSEAEERDVAEEECGSGGGGGVLVLEREPFHSNTLSHSDNAFLYTNFVKTIRPNKVNKRCRIKCGGES